ncbi:MAG: exodeoxyribonuclease VII large subunit [Chloroflexota bacterium]
MAHLPFSPSPVRYSISPMQILAVGELAQYIRDYLRADDVLNDVWVEGEISSLTRANSGHFYFTVRDERSQFPCVMFRGAVASAGVLPEAGMAVSLHGEVSFYEAGGKLQLIVDLLYPAGLGQGQLLFEALRLKLEKEGLFADERKRPLPLFPRRIGLVTSDGGAVLHDVLNVIGRRYPAAEIVFAHSAVQGESAPRELIRAINLIGWYHLHRAAVDVLIVGRGGGSAEDLAAFNDEGVARAIFSSPVPVVSAVGHEVDFSIADFVADRRAPTPSAAAELVTPDSDELRQRLHALIHRGARIVQHRLDVLRNQDRSLELRLAAVSPLETIKLQRLRIASAIRGGAVALENRLGIVREQLEGRQLQLDALSPRQTLARGYAIAVIPGRGVVTSVLQVQPGDQLQAILHDGIVESRVESTRSQE